MPERYPATEPYDAGMLAVADGSSPGRRRWFGPAAYRIVQFERLP